MKSATITVNLRDLVIVRQVFMPKNPNKLRGADREVVSACHRIIHEINRLASLPVTTESTDQSAQEREDKVITFVDPSFGDGGKAVSGVLNTETGEVTVNEDVTLTETCPKCHHTFAL